MVTSTVVLGEMSKPPLPQPLPSPPPPTALLESGEPNSRLLRCGFGEAASKALARLSGCPGSGGVDIDRHGNGNVQNQHQPQKQKQKRDTQTGVRNETGHKDRSSHLHFGARDHHGWHWHWQWHWSWCWQLAENYELCWTMACGVWHFGVSGIWDSGSTRTGEQTRQTDRCGRCWCVEYLGACSLQSPA